MHTLIFDFDGTIADSFQVTMEAANSLSTKYGYRPIDRSEFPRFKQLGTRKIIKELKIPMYKIPPMIADLRNELKKRQNECKPFDGIGEQLRKLHDVGHTMHILTSNDVESVENYLKVYNLEYFDSIHSEHNIFGKHKPLRRMLKEFNLDRQDVLYIGDELRDFEACKKVGVEFVGVTWGYSTEELLKNNGCTRLIPAIPLAYSTLHR